MLVGNHRRIVFSFRRDHRLLARMRSYGPAKRINVDNFAAP
jgi:hypothetical protein